MGNTSRTSLYWDEEATYGVLPGSPAFTAFRTTGDSLKTEKETETSDEIRNDRQNADVIEIGQSVGGSIPSEYTMGTHDDHIEAGMGAAAAGAEVTETDTNYSIDDADNSINDSTNGFTSDGFVAKKWVRLSGFTTTANNGYFKIDSLLTPSGGLASKTTVSAANGDSSFNDSVEDLSVFVADQKILVSGWTSPAEANNGIKTIVSATSNKIVVVESIVTKSAGDSITIASVGTLVLQGGTLVDEIEGDTVTILQGAQVVNGVAERTFTYERRHADLSNIFEQYYGNFINGFTFTFPAKGKTTIEYDILGQKETSTSSSVASSDISANEFNVLSAANNLKKALIDFTSICLMSGSLTTNNNGNVDTVCAGEKFPEEQTIGDFNVTAELGILFSDHTHKDVFLAHTSVNFSMAWEDAGGRGMVMEIVAAKFTDEATPVEGKSQKLIETLTLEGLMDSTEDIMFRYTTFTA